MMLQLITKPNFPFVDNRGLQTRAHVGTLFRFPSNCTSVFMKSFLYKGMQSWNQLPSDLRNIITLDLFKKLIKQRLRERELELYGEWSVVSYLPMASGNTTP